MVHRVLVAVTAVLAATALSVASAAADPVHQKVGPRQTFAGLVNGKNGLTGPAVIKMACVGPIHPGQTGHPVAGQTVEVARPTISAVPSGFTGSNANHIVALFHPPVSTVPPTTDVVTFRRYGVAKTIPTSLVLPCAGTGSVLFVPLPASSTARAAVVRVTYMGAPVTVAPPHIVARPDNVMVNTEVQLVGVGFPARATLTIEECGSTTWVVVAQQPCDTANTITVHTNPRGRFKSPFTVDLCPRTTPPPTPITQETCFIGNPQPRGVDTITLVGAAKVTVTYP